MKPFLVLLLLTAALLPRAAHACSCLPPGSVAEQRAKSERVFLGRVQGVELIRVIVPDGKPEVVSKAGERFGRLPPMAMPALHYKRVHLQVQEMFKGTPVPQVAVETGMWDGDCGVPFRPGQEYVVYVQPEEGRPMAGACSRTGLASDPESGLDELRAGE